MDKGTAGAALALMTALAVFAAVQPVLPQGGQRFSELGILGAGGKVAGYPTSVEAGHPFRLYGYIGNHEGASEYYQVLVKVGNQSTQVDNSTFASAPVLLTYSRVLGDNQSATFPLEITLDTPGTGVRLIFELWSFNVTASAFQYDGLWNQLSVNVTAG